MNPEFSVDRDSRKVRNETMALTKDDIINAVADMSVMEVVELIEAMEEKFGE